MRKLAVFSGLVLLVALTHAPPVQGADTIRIGFNIPLTGDAPKVGEGSKYAAEIRLAEINGTGGLRSATRAIDWSSFTKTTNPRRNPQQPLRSS